jgi:hypothetical protein
MEFRAFVRNNTLLGICQREVTGFYEALLEREDEFTDLILDFWMENLKDEFGGGDYTFDVYVTKESKVKLLDFNTGVALLFRSCSHGRSLKRSLMRVELLLMLSAAWLLVKDLCNWGCVLVLACRLIL